MDSNPIKNPPWALRTLNHCANISVRPLPDTLSRIAGDTGDGTGEQAIWNAYEWVVRQQGFRVEYIDARAGNTPFS